MIRGFTGYIVAFFLVVAIQVLIFNNIQLSGFIVPYIYVLFLLLLPFDTPGWVLLLTGFLLGFFIDVFADTLGMHTIATTFIAFSRPYVLNLIAPREGYETGTKPRVSYYGLVWFVKYSGILVFIHHLLLFYIEVFRFGGFFSTLLRVIVSSLITLLLIIISQFFIFRK
ncbi:MAG: rod shape-determining protein MreD [Bacteroidales bacterium]|nr:rod shape-determining protein MreD [Bacteroidales bacterium]